MYALNQSKAELMYGVSFEMNMFTFGHNHFCLTEKNNNVNFSVKPYGAIVKEYNVYILQLY